MKFVEIEKSEIFEVETETVYDLEVEEDSSYCVGHDQIVVHNCTTRIKTAVGVPQASLVHEMVEVRNQLSDYDLKIISDGGCRTPGHVSTAFVLGADAVMLGGMLSGSQESLYDPNVSWGPKGGLIFSGNSSEKANGYDPTKTYRTVEGKTVEIQPRGPMANIIQDILGGVRSTCTYVGAERISDLPKYRYNIQKVRRQVDNYD